MDTNIGIRLACMECDRTDYDPTTLDKAVEDGWDDISKCPPIEDWWTHLGYCPECREQVEEMRLKCIYCGPDEGLVTNTEEAKEAGWTGIVDKEELATDDERSNGSLYTHLGLCPLCAQIVQQFRKTGE